MNSITPSGGLSAKDSAQILKSFDKDSETKKQIDEANAQICQLDSTIQQDSALLAMDRKDRIAKAPELYRECYSEMFKEKGIKTLEILCMGGAAAGFFIGAAAGGMNALVFFGLIGTALLGPAALKGILVSNKKVDQAMVQKLQQQQAEHSKQKTAVEDKLNRIKSEIIKEAAKNVADEAAQSASQDPAKVDDVPEYVVIDGVKLDKKKLAHLGGLPW
jgi:hypothetical protein